MSRIFEPEPAAASFRLGALAEEILRRGHELEVLTTVPPKRHAASERFPTRRWPVLRDRQGYVRGYVSYLSFDLPLFFRLVFARRNDVIVVEPPPTTGFFARLACAVRRTPYVYYAADVWSDAASQTSASRPVLTILRLIERWVWRGAARTLAVSPGVEQRVSELEPKADIVLAGNGVDTSQFLGNAARCDGSPRNFVYGGTASEWHGAEVFVRAFAQEADAMPDSRLVFIGGGSERENLSKLSHELDVHHRVDFRETMPPRELGAWLSPAVASLASVRPGSGYDFAFPTKLYSSAACGAPLIYAGPGPAREFVQTQVGGRPIGEATEYDVGEVAAAMLRAYRHQNDAGSRDRREQVSSWAFENVSLRGVAGRIVDQLERLDLESRT